MPPPQLRSLPSEPPELERVSEPWAFDESGGQQRFVEALECAASPEAAAELWQSYAASGAFQEQADLVRTHLLNERRLLPIMEHANATATAVASAREAAQKQQQR